jgi:plasmid stabilization system protein ParE
MERLQLSQAADLQVRKIVAYYVEKAYDSAFLRLIDSIEFAMNPVNLSRHIFHAAPRPVPALTRLGVRWMLHHRYWFAFDHQDPPVIVAVIDAASDIKRHARHLPHKPVG